jgi:heme/copper-type cytochrome/quinol oxidase subunit 4
VTSILPVVPLLFAVTQAWSVGALIAFVLVFNCIPAVLELLTFLFVARVSYFSY